ncbi:MAG: HAMP domain-containing protein [Nitrospirae bacterium]|nr:HAMP domain-containing protein [Nitrospirota bacterium]
MQQNNHERTRLFRRLLGGSIRTQLVFGIALVHAILMTIFVFDMVERQRAFLKEQTAAQATSLAETLAANSISWVLASDVIGLDEVVQSQSKYPGLLYAMVTDKDGCILGYTEANLVRKYLNDPISVRMLHSQPGNIILLNSSKQVDAAAPLLIDGQHIGWARVGLSHKRLSGNLRVITRHGIIYTVVAIVAGTIFALFMARRLTGGLKHIVNIAERVSHGEIHLRSRLNRIDELGALSKDFDIMLDSLEQRGEELKQAQNERLMQEQNARAMQEQMLIQQSRLAAMGEMIGAIAHQWRQPLNIISILVADLKDAYDFGEFTKEYLYNSVKKTKEQIKHMAGTIDDFKNFFKPGKEKVFFKINTAVKEVINLMSAQLTRANVTVSLVCKYDAERKPPEGRDAEICTCEPELMCYGCPNELKQALINIFGNARDAIVKNRQSGAMDDQAKGEILVELTMTDALVILIIRDNGGGIPEDVIDNIFVPYFTTKGDEGTGIGLHMSKIIIERKMGGRIYASNGERGAVFTIELPLSSQGKDAAHKENRCC